MNPEIAGRMLAVWAAAIVVTVLVLRLHAGLGLVIPLAVALVWQLVVETREMNEGVERSEREARVREHASRDDASRE